MAANWVKSRQTQYGAYLAIYLVIILAVLVTLNWLANQHNRSIDTTANQRYTLSPQTRKIVEGIKEPVTVTYFDETNRLAPARDLLDRYAALSPNLKVVYVDPFKKPQIAREYGIRQAGAIVIQSGNRRQEARGLSESDLTSALVRVLKTRERSACFTTGAGEHALDSVDPAGYAGVKQLLERDNFKTRSVNLLETPSVPAGCTVLVLGGPRVDYPDAVVDAVHKFVEGGGRALFLLDPPLEVGKAKIAKNESLVKMLSGWGVNLVNDQVLDTSGVGGVYGLGPEVALATKYAASPITRDLGDTATAFAMVRSLDVARSDESSSEVLVYTSPNSFATKNLSGDKREIDVAKGEVKSFGVAASGTLRAGKPEDAGRFVVVGSSDWVANYIIRFAGNRDLFLNMMSWLSSDEDLISIRPVEPEDRRITLSRFQMQTLRGVTQFFIPLLILAAGAIVWWRRR